MKNSPIQIIFGLAILSLIGLPLQAEAKKEKVQSDKEAIILLPLVISAEVQSMVSEMQAAVVQGLQQKYLVYSGERVLQELKKAANKENHAAKRECDETKCLQDISVAFQTENVAVVHINKIEGGYLLSLSIKAVISNEALFDNSLPCRGCDAFQVVERLKEFVGLPEGAAKAAPKDTSLVATSASGNNAGLNINCTGDDVGAEVWVNDKLRGECPVELKVPDGKVILKLVKVVDTDHERLYKQTVTVFADSTKRIDVKLELQLTAEGIRNNNLLVQKIEGNMVVIPNKNYALGKYNVTQAEWRDVMGNNPSKFTKCGDICPVEQVSWDDVQEFILKLNSKTGKQFRLPNEEEWEYACYAGSKTRYCGGKDRDSFAWFDIISTHPVGQKQANGFGLYDMSGSVWQWMQNESGSGRVLRGGSDMGTGFSASLSTNLHSNYDINNGRYILGFRLARTLP
jgi:hypothetical protein